MVNNSTNMMNLIVLKG